MKLRYSRRRDALVASAVIALAASAMVCITSIPDAQAEILYTTSPSSNTVSVTDSGTGKPIGSPIQVGTSPRGIAISPDGSRIYVTNVESNSVSIVDAAAAKVIGKSIPVGKQPVAVAISPDGDRAYVANFGSSTLSVIDTHTRKVIAEVGVGTSPLDVALTPSGRRAYVTSFGAGLVSAIDTRTNHLSGAPIVLSKGVFGIAITPDGSRAYVTNEAQGSVAVIDLASNQVVAGPLAVGQFPRGVAITPDGSRAYVTALGSGDVSTIDTGTNQLLGPPLALGGGPIGIVASPDGRHLDVASLGASTISDIDIAANRLVGPPIPVDGAPFYIATPPDQPPTASFEVGPARPGVPVIFDASSAADPDGTIASYDWSFGDKRKARLSKPEASHTFRATGRYRTTLKVTDREGCSTKLVFTGHTASCSGSSTATSTVVVRVSYPGVRLGCPQRVGPGVCKYVVQAIGAQREPQSAQARATVRAGHSRIVSLHPRKRFRAKLAKARRISVKLTATIGSMRSTHIRKLNVVR